MTARVPGLAWAWLYALAAATALALGVGVRLWHFPDVPPGLNVDEALSAYEAFSLAKTGHDQWGTQWPAYFQSWGSGQSVLLAYLTVPVVKALGLSILSARLVSLVLGLLSLPLFFYCLRPWGRYPALLGLLLLGLAPWHFMLVRWGLDCNLAPFWMLLGCSTLARAIGTQRRRWIIPSLLPFAVALYAYGTTVLVLPGLLLVVAGCCWGRLRQQPGAWLLAAGLALVVATPFLLFFLENYVLHRNLAWTDQLFFGTPLLPATRLSQVAHDEWPVILAKNIAFLRRGFDDYTIYNQLPGFPVLLHLTRYLAIAGFAGMLYQLGRLRTQLASRPAEVVGLLFLAWELGCLPLFFLFELNINRVNHFFLPCLGLAVYGAALLVKSLPGAVPKPVAWGVLLLWFGVDGGRAAHNYLVRYPHQGIARQFNAGLAEAFAVADRLPGVAQVRVTSDLSLPYMYTLFYLRYPPAQFRHEVQRETINGMYKVHKFGKYVFTERYLRPGQPYGYLSHPGEFSEDARHHKTVVYSSERWEVGTMRVLAGSTLPSQRTQP